MWREIQYWSPYLAVLSYFETKVVDGTKHDTNIIWYYHKIVRLKVFPLSQAHSTTKKIRAVTYFVNKTSFLQGQGTTRIIKGLFCRVFFFYVGDRQDRQIRPMGNFVLE